MFVLEDNEGFVQLTKNNTFHDQTKHIDVKNQMIVGNVKNNRNQKDSIASKDNIAYMMAKVSENFYSILLLKKWVCV